jgi:hypothetical protein
MLTSRSLNVVRTLVLAAVSAIVVGIPAIVGAQTPAPTPAVKQSSAAATRKQARSTVGKEQSEQSERLQKMIQRLKLTDEQVAKVKSILADKQVQADQLRAKFKGQTATPESKAAMEKAHKDLRADTDAKLAQVLSADQMAEYKTIRGEHRKHEGAKEEKEEEAKEGKK